jgi:hypothetical protein
VGEPGFSAEGWFHLFQERNYFATTSVLYFVTFFGQPSLSSHKRVASMRSTNHRKYPTRSYRNDYDIASFGNSPASVLSTRNAARLDGGISASGQMAAAETILSGRAIALARKGCIHEVPGATAGLFPDSSNSDLENEPVFCYRATLFDSVMEFLDRHDRMAAQLQSFKSVE